MPSRHPAQRTGAPLRPRRALVILSALGAGLVVGRIVDILDYAAPVGFGLASVAASCGVGGVMRRLKAESEADPIG